MERELKEKESLLKAGFDLIKENPGIEQAEWAQAMIDCNCEIVDSVYGIDKDTIAMLMDVWECDDYEDPDTGVCLGLNEWSSFFAGDYALFVYDQLRNKLKKEIQ